MFSTWKRTALALGLSLAVMPAARAADADQKLADAVASALRSTSALQGYRIEIDVKDGMVTLTGAVNHPVEHDQAIGLARQVSGVAAVVDYLRVTQDASVQPAQYQQVAMGGHFGHGGGGSMGGYPGGMGGGPIMDGGYAGDPGSMGGPMPEGSAGFSGATQASSPGYPNYAWPSYAPYPNFSAVGYPTAYPWQAFPNIGPFYPYPEVPLDWRAVTLRWDDGIWFLDFKKHYTRPFFTPYPFGILAY
jgi:BON domain